MQSRSSRLRHAFLLLAILALGYQTARAADKTELQPWECLKALPPLPPSPRSGWVPVNGIRMYYAVYGQGRPVLLIHNGLGSADDWAGVVSPLTAAGLQVLVADTRGFGRSTRNGDAYTYDLLASDYLGLLDQLGLGQVYAVGSSDGAIIALKIALAAPDRIRGLFLQGGNVTVAGVQNPPLQMSAIRAALTRAADEYRRLSATPGEYQVFRAQVGAMPAPDISKEALARIRVPTCVALCDHEESIKPDHTRMIAAAIPGARLTVLKNVSHFAPLQDPAQFAAAVIVGEADGGGPTPAR